MGRQCVEAEEDRDRFREALVMMTDRARHEGWCDREHGHDCTCGLVDDKAKVLALLGGAPIEKPTVQP
jgi:hypothetical protein